MSVESPVLFIVFNRPDTTARVFSRIRDARPAKLFIAADGPRDTREGEAQLCAEVRQIATAVDWPCEVKTLFREKNLGCKYAVSSAITWFFEHVEEGIILEDDCEPAPDFFRFCDTLLAHYRHDTRIRHIGGSNLQHGRRRGDASYYFSRLSHVWGWATWRRAWKDYDVELSAFSDEQIDAFVQNRFEPVTAHCWLEMIHGARKGTLNTWDVQWVFTNWIHDALNIIPNVNLISNIGFDARATHTIEHCSNNAALSTGTLGPIIHPIVFAPTAEADAYTMDLDFNLLQRRRKADRLKYRLKRWLARHGGPSRWQRAGF
jgi:hypothetical protein